MKSKFQQNNHEETETSDYDEENDDESEEEKSEDNQLNPNDDDKSRDDDKSLKMVQVINLGNCGNNTFGEAIQKRAYLELPSQPQKSDKEKPRRISVRTEKSGEKNSSN